MMSSKRLPRLAMQLVCLALATLALWPALPWKDAGRFTLQVSPFVAICSSIAVRALGAGAAAGLIVAGLAVIRPRFFCRYICPTGLLLEGAAKIGLQKTAWWKRCPALGKYAALVTAAGAVVGYPVLLWMDPLSIFSSFFAVRTAATVASGIVSVFGLVVLALLSWMSGPIWCARLCPLGGTQEILSSAASGWKIAGIPSSSPDASSGTRTGPVARRAFIVAGAGVGLGFFAKTIGAARGENAPLRPPGAVDEGHFAGLCLRCGNCMRACPSKIIRPDIGSGGIAGLLAPALEYRDRYCLEDCNACPQVCPSGALERLDLKQKTRYVIGEALVDGSLCLLALGRKDCDACEQSCPFDAVHTRWDEQRYVAYPVVNTDKCNGCGACEVACPTENIKAIRVWRRPD